MLRVYSRSFVVPAGAIDAYQHVNNIAYVEWMQEAGIAHITALGWPVERCLEAGTAWVVRSHFIEYRRPAFEGEAVTVYSWLAGTSGGAWPRRFLFLRDADKKPLVRAETVYVCVDPKSGRPIQVPAEMAGAFPEATSDDEVAAMIGIAPFGK